MIPDFVWHFLFWLYVAATLAQLAFLGFGIWGLGCRIRSAQSPIPNPQSAIPNPKSEIPNPKSQISIVICARNEAENLRRHLPKILEQQYPGECEVIVVDDASDDETPAVLQFFLKKNARLRVVQIFEKQHVGKKYALAQGIAAAKFGNLLLTDADCEPASPLWSAHMAATLEEKSETEMVLGFGPMRPPLPRSTPPPTPPLKRRGEVTTTRYALRLSSHSGEGSGGGVSSWSRFETAHTAIQYFSFALAGMPYMGVGRNLAFKKKAYERVGGFAAHLDVISGDDDLLVNAAAHSKNVAICLHPESFVFSESKKTWREWARQKRRHLAAGRRYRRKHQLLLALLSGSHVLHFFLLCVLLLAGFGMVSVVTLLFLRSLFVFFLYRKILPRLRESSLLSRVPMYDTLLAAYYGAFVPISLIVYRNARFQWK